MKRVILLCLLLLLPVSAKAGDTSAPVTGEKIYQLEPVIVTATRYPEHLRNVTSYSTQLVSSRLKNFNLLTLGEVLKNFSNGEMKSSGELGQVQMQAQSPSRYPISPLARWKISELTLYFDNDGSNQQITAKYEYFIDSDTTIGSRQYYKLYRSGIAYYDTPFYYQNVYAGAIRDEDNKFYLVRKDHNEEVFLIDFNLELGDTIRGEIGNGSIINLVETMPDGRKSISSVPEICGGCCSTITLLEGIGHSGGIMEDPPCYHIGYDGHYLNCFETDGELLYQNNMSLVDCGDSFTSVDRVADMPDVNISLVPGSGILSVEILNIRTDHSILSIFDITGSLVLKSKIQSNKTELDIRQLGKGIYLIRIADEVNSYTRKFFVE